MPGFDHRLAVLLVSLLLAAGPARADYKQDYARGTKAAESQDWSEVEARMREALKGSTQPLARTRLYGQVFMPYVPHYYLGLAAYRQGNCREALRWFDDPAAAGVIADNKEFRGIADEARQQCKAQLAQAKPAAKPTPPPVTAPAQPVAVAPVAKPPAQNVPKATPPVSQPTPTPPAVTAANTSLPAALQGLLDDYLAGRFSEAARADANGVTGSAAVRFHALLLRSAARHALSELQGAEGGPQRSAAEDDIKTAKKLAPGKVPDNAYFSPRFRKFFSETR